MQLTSQDSIALLALMAQEADESARAFGRMADRQPRTSVGSVAARNARQDAAHFTQKAAACRAGMIALSKEP